MKAIVSYSCFLGIGLLAVFSAAHGQDTTQAISKRSDEAREEKIANATSAAPASISDSATVMDWPAGEEGRMITLRKGSNNFTCMPDRPDTPANDPMCLDKPWMQWLNAWINDEVFKTGQIGFGYMLQGGIIGNNTEHNYHGNSEQEGSIRNGGEDHEKKEMAPPHVMILVPDTMLLNTLPQKPKSGGPWVVCHGTSFAYIAVPLGDDNARYRNVEMNRYENEN